MSRCFARHPTSIINNMNIYIFPETSVLISIFPSGDRIQSSIASKRIFNEINQYLFDFIFIHIY